LADVDRFSKFFHQVIHKKILYVFPPHLQYVATLPCESRKYKNVTDFYSTSTVYRVLTCSRGHVEDLI